LTFTVYHILLLCAITRWQSEESYVALAFERFWQATVQQQVAFRTFAGALAYLRASLNGALLDTLRAYMRPRGVPLPEPGAPGELSFEDRTDSGELWEILQRVLPSEREQRLAYLLYHCNLKPREIVRFCQEEGPMSRRSTVCAAPSWSASCARRTNSVGGSICKSRG